MSFDAVQERLAALQETTAQVKELIDRLATLNFQPGSVPLGNGNDDDDDDDENVATELSAEINQILREEEEDLELLVEELTDLRGGKEGSETARRKERLREGVERLEGDVKRYAMPRIILVTTTHGLTLQSQLSYILPQSPALRPPLPRRSPPSRTPNPLTILHQSPLLNALPIRRQLARPIPPPSPHLAQTTRQK